MSRENGIIIAIDGPSGAGKSTLAKGLAARLGYMQIDTGAMYRAMAFLANDQGIDLSDMDAVRRFCDGADVELRMSNGSSRVFANGIEITGLIRTPQVSMLTSKISALFPVREAMTLLQRKMGAKGGVVLEGRDIGTVVFPDAELKFYLSASPEERGRRRYLELVAKGEKVSLDETIRDVIRRDEQDSRREIAPLRQAEDAVPVDSTGLCVDELLSAMEDEARRIIAGKDS